MTHFTYSNHHAVMGCRIIAEDDDIAFEDERFINGIMVTGLQSKRQGSASLLLARLIAEHGHKPLVLIAHASSGEHERLKNLYRRFGFEGDTSLMVRFP